jgi:hypothetical protein
MARMLALLLLAALAAPPDEGRVVERIVAVVRNPAGAAPRPITLTKLTEEARIALVGQGAMLAATAPLDAPALAAALRLLVDEWLVADEATRLKVDELPREQVLAALRRFQARFPDRAGYQAFLATVELTEEELEVTLARGLKVQRYLESRVGSPEASPLGATRLPQDSFEVRVRQHLDELRGRADVRVLVPELRQDGAR